MSNLPLFRVCDTRNPVFHGDAWFAGNISENAKFRSMMCDGKTMILDDAKYTARQLHRIFKRVFYVVDPSGAIVARG